MQPPSFELEINREEVDELRKRLEVLPNKTPENQQVLLEFFDHVEGQQQQQADKEAPAKRRKVFKFAKLTLQSGAKNALSGRMISQLTERLDEIEQWLLASEAEEDANEQEFGGHALLIEGANGTFCSGSDLVAVRASANQLQGLELAKVMQYNCLKLEQLPLISVAHLEGYALGGGAELALAADFRLMSRK